MKHLRQIDSKNIFYIRTVADSSSGDLPQDEAQGPDVHSLEGLKAVHLDGVVKHLRGHVALCAHLRVVPHIQFIGVLKMHDCQTCFVGN